MTRNDDDYSRSIDDFIKKIKSWYASDHEGFGTMYDAAVKNVKPLPDGTPDAVKYEWKDRTINDLCNFFRDWYKWEPGVTTGLDYIEKFSWINYQNDYGMVFVTSGPGGKMIADFTNLQGLYMDSDKSKKLVEKWIEALGPKKMADFKIPDKTRPDGGFNNFNHFFARELADGKRPIDAHEDDSVVVAPTDCVVNMIVDELTETTPIPVKSVTMNVEELLNGSDYASNFLGGTAVSCILMPDTYHWYHAPVAGVVVESHDNIGGIYYGMRDFPELLNKGNVGYGYDYSMFDNFRRGCLIIATNKAGGSDHGYVGMVPVGLNSIASVQFEEKFRDIPEKKDPTTVVKGERIGCFKYGGSLNILLFEPGRFPALQLLQGQRIGHFEAQEKSAKLFSGSWRRPSRHRQF